MPRRDAICLSAAAVVYDEAEKLFSVGRNVEALGRGGKTDIAPHVERIVTPTRLP